MLRVLVIALALAACTYSVPMGGACESSDECAEPGVCLKGACSGYPCKDDGECDEDWECGKVGGVRACVIACEGDAECPGEQECGGEGVCL